MPSRFEIDDELWAEVEPLIPLRPRRRRYPGRRALPDHLVLDGVLHVLHTGIAWEDLPQECGYGSGVTCWRRLRDWQRAGVWEALRQRLLVRLDAAGAIAWSRACIDSSHVLAPLGAPDGTIPGRSGPRGLKAPPAGRRYGHPSGGLAHRRQPQRRRPARAAAGRAARPNHQGQVWPAPAQARPPAGRPGLRPRPLPAACAGATSGR